jgi:hypothetical protein
MSTNAAIPAPRAPIVISNDNHGATAFIIEAGDIAAGVVVREGRRYRFFSAHADFRTLDGQSYASPRAAQKAAHAVRAASVRKLTAERSSLWAVLTL